MGITDTVKNAVGLGSDESAAPDDKKAATPPAPTGDSASAKKAAEAVKKPNAPIASGIVRAGAEVEEQNRIDPLAGTQYANNVKTEGYKIHIRARGGQEDVQAEIEKVLGKLDERDDVVVEMAELRHGSDANIQVEPMFSPVRRKQMDKEADLAQRNAEKVEEDSRREQQENREKSLRGGR